ncbi:hypothetical protein AMTRI_Chr04g182310 [Amborella trichopoda]
MASRFGDTAYTKVFVGGLAWETQAETMREYFDQFGDILEAVVITDKSSGRSKGYGFVTFSEPEAARLACEDPNPVIDGRRTNCNIASFGRPAQPPLTTGRGRAETSYRGPPSYTAGPTTSTPYTYQQGFIYPPYGYAAYNSDYMYHQNVYNPYLSPRFPQMYGGSTTTNPTYPYGYYMHPGASFSGYERYVAHGPRQIQQYPIRPTQVTSDSVSSEGSLHVLQSRPAQFSTTRRAEESLDAVPNSESRN